jgi:hypothetical protein
MQALLETKFEKTVTLTFPVLRRLSWRELVSVELLVCTPPKGDPRF